MPTITRKISTQNAFFEWDPIPASAFGKKIEELRTQLSFTSRGEYCHVCGKRIPVGIQATKGMATWGPTDYESALLPMHKEPCIPTFEVTFRTDDDEYTFGNSITNAKWIDEFIEDPDVRTLEEAKKYASYIFKEKIALNWMSYTIKQDEKIVYTEGEASHRSSSFTKSV